jgi:N-carbamoyl-L-amino-acid hydrolase
VEKRCSGEPGLVGTVGRLQVPEGAVNVIPGCCELSLDVRAPADSVRHAAYGDIVAECGRIAGRRNVNIDVSKVLEVSAVPCSAAMQRRIGESICRVTGCAEARYLPSGAGHDAMMMASLTEIGMLFVRCGNGGISHHPDESLDGQDADLAGRVLMDFLLSYASDTVHG